MIAQQKKVAVGLSGGVDSAVTATLLVEQGYQVQAVYLECWRAPGCRTDEDRKDALAVALQLGIPFQVLDFKQQYKERVVENFFTEYEAGRTPNPDVLCNKEIKFGLFYEWAMANGFDFIATGHYARVLTRSLPLVAGERQAVRRDEERGERPIGKQISVLASSCDQKKDQTYFLYRLRAEQLEHILFPIGHLTKLEVRKLAEQKKLPVAKKADSQGICFIGEINVHNFLRERLGEQPGEVINTHGEVIGRHSGLWFFTVGQRHGFEISGKWKSQSGEWKHAMPPYYVIKKIPEKNQLVVGFGAETYQQSFTVSDVHRINDNFQFSIFDKAIPSNNLVRIRHGGKMIPCTITAASKTNDQLLVQLIEPTQGIAEGQSSVFYAPGNNLINEYLCIGGGVITYS